MQVETSVDSEKAIAIDLGVNNLAACFDTDGHQFLIDGKRLKSINHWYNKRNAKLQSAKDKQGIKGITNKQARLNQKVSKRNLTPLKLVFMIKIRSLFTMPIIPVNRSFW